MAYELVIIGAGLSGIAAAVEAHGNGLERVLVVDYEDRIGGFASGLLGTGLFEAEAELLQQAAALPYEFRYRSTVVGFFPGEDGSAHQIGLQSPQGSDNIEAERVMLCSGSLEKPREAHKIAGTRPAGVMTPMMAVNLLKRGYAPGERILLIEHGRLSHGAAALLEQNGCLLERLDGSQWDVLEVLGGRRVSGVKLANNSTGEEQTVGCDTLIYGEGRIPCTFYLKGSEVDRDSHHAIVVDELGQTNIPRVSAAGTCTIHGDDDHFSSIASARTALQHLLNTTGFTNTTDQGDKQR